MVNKMAKRNSNKSVSSVPVVESSVSEVSETTLLDVLGPVSSEVSNTVSEVLSEVLNEVSSETVVELSAKPEEVVETVPVAVPNHLLPNFNRWLSSTLVRKANGGVTANGKRLGRKPSVFTKTLSLVKLPKTSYFVPSKRGRPVVGSVLTSITVPKDLVVTPETRFNVDLTTGDWSVVVPEEVRETLAA